MGLDEKKKEREWYNCMKLWEKERINREREGERKERDDEMRRKKDKKKKER